MQGNKDKDGNLRCRPIVPEDNTLVISQPPSPLHIPVDTFEERKIVFKIYKEDDPRILKYHKRKEYFDKYITNNHKLENARIAMLKHEEAVKLVPARELKQLRQDRQICFQTLDNKYIYPLIELLAHKGIKEYIAYDVRNVQEQIEFELGDTEPAQEIEEKERGIVITNALEEGIREEPTEEQVKAHMEQYLPKEEEPQEVDFEEELRREIKYVEPFTYPSKSLPEGQKHNVFRVHNPDRTRDFVESISGVVTRYTVVSSCIQRRRPLS